MYQLLAVALLELGISATVLFGGEATPGKYSTSFFTSENPISEGGRWINGKTAGLDWSDVKTTNGLVLGLQAGPTGYDDAVALLTGTWGPNQAVAAVVHTTKQNNNINAEVEIRLRSSVSPHNCTGYEVLFSLKTNSECYVQIVRWNGRLNDFSILESRSGSRLVLQEDDEIMASITNQTIKAFLNGVQVLEAVDRTYPSGNPGIGFFLAGTTAVNENYGFKRLIAWDAAAKIPLFPQNNRRLLH